MTCPNCETTKPVEPHCTHCADVICRRCGLRFDVNDPTRRFIDPKEKRS